MKKNIVYFGLILLSAAMLHARASSEVTDVTIYCISGSSGVGMIRLFENIPVIPGYNVNVEAIAQADLVAAKFIAGEAKIGLLPPNIAAKIASSGIKIQIAAVTGMGMLSLLSSDPSVRSIDDLRGREIEVAVRGATPDYVIRKILLSRGIDPDNDVKLNYSLGPPEIAQALIAGRVSLALLPEPFATMAMQGRGISVVGNIQQEWEKITGSSFPMTVLVVNGDFASANKNFVNTILGYAENSVEWVVANPLQAGQLVEKYELGMNASVVQAAIPRSNYVFVPAQQARASLEALFSVFLEFAPVSIGGALPSDNFYYRP
jgi:NitT/TauT family transport system substrate-binding protein